MRDKFEDLHADLICDVADMIIKDLDFEIRLEKGELQILVFHPLDDSESNSGVFKKIKIRKLVLSEWNAGLEDDDFIQMADAFLKLGQWMKSKSFFSSAPNSLQPKPLTASHS
jgi:hypothetical protein